MNELTTHPGFLPAEERSFNLYSKFIKPDGLSEWTLKWFIDSLQDFYMETRDSGIWLPFNCRLIDLKLEFFTSAFYPAKTSIKRFKRSHYWFEASIGNDRYILVVDPAGVVNDKVLVDKSRLFTPESGCVPYFGLKTQSRGLRKEIYASGEDLDSFATDIPEEELTSLPAE